MELNITRFIRAHRDNMNQLSSSVAESGLENIGQVTWRNACEAMAYEEDQLVTNTADLAALREHFSECGAWDQAELEVMGSVELNALLAQFIAGEWQGRERALERGGRKALREYEECEGGRISGAKGGRWFYYVGC